MCTAISINGHHHLFGRTLDLECSFGEAAVISPRAFFSADSFSMVGIAHVSGGVPLYYDAVNEHGLCAAALNFPASARYQPPRKDINNIPSYKLIPFVLGTCKSVDEATELLCRVNVTPDSFSDSLPATPLHWLFADKRSAIAVEPREDGLVITHDPFRVLTNEPPFEFHEKNVTAFMSLSASPPKNNLCPEISLAPYSRGMGAMGLPGDFSSASRFVRAVFALNHTVGEDEISRFFHVMDTVTVPNGCILTDKGVPVRTVYTSCADTDSLTYYFTDYSCRRIRAVRLCESAKADDSLTVFPIERDEDILRYN